MEKFSVMGILNGGFPPNAMDAYRILYPIRALEEKGFRTQAISMRDFYEMAQAQDRQMLSYDVYLFSRLTGDEKDQENFRVFLDSMRKLGKTVIVDYDDDYTNKHRIVTHGGLGGVEEASAISTSTEYLRQVMKPYNRNVVVAPNLLVPEIFDKFERQIDKDKLIIGLTGSITHKSDWPVVYEPVKRILAEFPHVSLFCSGLIPEEFQGHPQLLTIKAIKEDWDVGGFVQLADYGRIHRNIDILLCPVDPADKFNWSKSNLKAIEGQASVRPIDNVRAGSFVIATRDLPIYRDAIVHGKTGMLVNHNEQDLWYSTIRRAILDVEFRHEVQKAGYQSVMANFNIHTRIMQRVAAYRHIRAMDLRKFRKFMTEVAASAQ